MLEILRAGCFVKPCGIENDDAAGGGVLPKSEHDFAIWQFQRLRLMDALVVFMIA